ncbi:MAG TPA: EamA family transporter [Geminicoccaceae bacterium]|nr:EamA family transporter [Geminicoccaceae bacterium]
MPTPTAREPGYAPGVAMVLAAGLCLSFNGLILRHIEGADGWQILFWRSLTLSALVFGFIAARHRGRIIAPVRAVGRPGLLVALLLGGGFVCYLFALLWTTVANVLFTLSAGPFFAALLAWAVLGERVSGATRLAIAAAMAGVALMAGGGLAAGGGAGGLIGIVLALGAVLSFAGTLVVWRRARGVDMVPATGLAGVVAAVVCALMIDDLTVPARDLALSALTGVLAAVGFTLLTLGARHVAPAEVALLGLGEAVLGPLWVWLGVGEVPGALTLAGGAVVLAAVVGQALGGLRRGRRSGAVAVGAVVGLLLVPAAAPALAQGGNQGARPADSSPTAYVRWADQVLARPPDGVQFLDRLERRIVELTNERRREQGLDPVEPDEALKRPARAHAISMLRRGYFAHETPGGRGLADRVALLARDFIGLPAENIFELRGVEPPFPADRIERVARTTVDGWMASSCHRANILGQEYDRVAVGAVAEGDRVVVTQVFGDRVATLEDPPPLTVKRGARLSLDLRAEDGVTAPTRYDYFRPSQGQAATLSQRLDSPPAMTEPGHYRLRFYVPRGGGSFEGYNGPDVVIE